MKSKNWKQGDLVLNVVTKRTAHFYQQIGFDDGYIVVLPRDGEKLGDEVCWPVYEVKRIQPFISLKGVT